MKKQIMSIAAIAAIFTTGASAFDAQRTTGIVGLETSATAFKTAIMDTNNTSALPSKLEVASAGTTGDALIFPAYYGHKGWSTEFSVINNSETEAVIAKVVLYSAIDSRELRDFNIYLSKNDVFRATIKDGKLISTDSSTRAFKQDKVSPTTVTKTGYTRKDIASMASESEPFETPIDEAVGYIAVFAMAQADNTNSYGSYAGYHGKHNQLWQDYRHMLDQCRGEGWRDKEYNYGGIFITTDMNTPNVDLDADNKADEPSSLVPNCGTVVTTLHTPSGNRSRLVAFKSPAATLSGSVLVKGDDSRGTRSLLLSATPITNFTDGNVSAMLWTEGELANIADRCLEDGTNTSSTNNDVQYDAACLAADASAFAIASTNYEFRDAANSQMLITQPYKRTALQIEHNTATATDLSGIENYYKSVKRATKGTKNIIDYGQFDLAQPAIYDDNERLSTNTSDGYIVSPAPILESTPGIINELSVFNPLGSYSDSVSGFARIKYEANAHGIVTQMSVSDVNGNEEVNWIYPVTTASN